MSSNRIDARLTPEQRTAVLAAVGTIRTNLPFLTGLSNEERRELNKLGDRSHAFAHAAYTVAQQNPGILPASFPLDAFRDDLALFDDLAEAYFAVQQLHEAISDTRLLAGSEAMAAARAVYYFVKGQPDGDRLDQAARELGLRFARPRRPAPDAPPEAPPSAPPA